MSGRGVLGGGRVFFYILFEEPDEAGSHNSVCHSVRNTAFPFHNDFSWYLKVVISVSSEP